MKKDIIPQANTNEGKKEDATVAARVTAEKDISNDPDLSIHHKNDDLDEGELARLGEDTPDIV